MKKLNDIENNHKLIKQEMKLRFEAVDKRFEILTNFIMALTAGIWAYWIYDVVKRY